MGLNMRNSVLLAKLETTYGVDATPTGALNAMLAKAVNVSPLEQDAVQRDLQRPYFGNDEQIPVGTRIAITFEIELAGSGAEGDAPAYGPLLLACAHSETINALVDVRYKPITVSPDDQDSVTLIYNLDGVQHKALGCKGTVSFAFDARGVPVMRFAFTGLYADVVDAAVTGVDFSAFIKPKSVNYRDTPSCTYFGQPIVVQSCSLDVGLQVVYRNLIGFEGVRITDRAARGALSFEYQKVIQYNWFQKVKNNESGALNLVHGTVAGNIIELDAPNVQPTGPTISDSDGTAMLNLNLNYNPTEAGNDEYELIVR
jgi:hypothetical protein